jgi:hypothetical protein
MKQGAQEKPSSEHEQVYHAAPRCQGKRSGLTPRRLHDRRRHAQLKAKKQAVWPLTGERDYAALAA